MWCQLPFTTSEVSDVGRLWTQERPNQSVCCPATSRSSIRRNRINPRRSSYSTTWLGETLLECATAFSFRTNRNNNPTSWWCKAKRCMLSLKIAPDTAYDTTEVLSTHRWQLFCIQYVKGRFFWRFDRKNFNFNLRPNGSICGRNFQWRSRLNRFSDIRLAHFVTTNDG